MEGLIEGDKLTLGEIDGLILGLRLGLTLGDSEPATDGLTEGLTLGDSLPYPSKRI